MNVFVPLEIKDLGAEKGEFKKKLTQQT